MVKQVYEKKTPREHVLLRPDMYIGSITPETKSVYVLSDDQTKMEEKSLTYIPGLLKIFDEILVNAIDNKQRDKSMSYVSVKIDKDKGLISIENDGQGIPVRIHKKYDIYNPELIFGHMLTSSNFDDNVKRVVGGRNGYGAKLTNIFSKKFVVETSDGDLDFKQTHSKNMTEKTEPVVKPSRNGKNFTKISFIPDFARFGLSELTEDCYKMIERRVYDIAGVSHKSVKVKLNGVKINVSCFKDYLNLFVTSNMPILHCKVNDRWEIGVSLSDGHFKQVSYVNSISTGNGGRHADHVADSIARFVASKKKDLKPRNVKDFMFLFVNCLIENPAFKSQTKDELTTKTKDFGSQCLLPDSFLKKVAKSQIVIEAIEMTKHKDARSRARKTDGKKTAKIFGIAKLTDARFAGTKQSARCTLILVEGDSAKTLALAGLPAIRGEINQHYYGIYPLKGKVLNVRDASSKQIAGSPEITNIKKILGLREQVDYGDERAFQQLRYGRLMVMVDQDFDGSHIKGLLINLFHRFWPSLMKRAGFLREFVTPIVVCSRNGARGGELEEFFTIPEYEKWKREAETARFTIKYYKGLGTSSNEEAERYFSNLRRHQIKFRYSGEEDDRSILLAFSKSKAEERKQWLADFVPGTYLDHRTESISFREFVYKELILFSMADNLRSIPSVMDGLKPGQRKILFTCLKRNLTKDAKIPQLAGFVMSETAYHHGDAALQGTVIKMAQRFVGSNNVSLLRPSGQFGSRAQGGKDAANPRYISTRLAQSARNIFLRDDDAVLKYLDDDGQSIEPEWYAPAIPMVLVNGAEGIGTGWSSSLPCFNPRDVIRCVRAKLEGGGEVELHPWYRNWKGSLRYVQEKRGYAVVGRVELVDSHRIRITELPVHSWTEPYKAHLAKLLESGIICNILEEHSVDAIDFTLETGTDNPISNISEFLLKTLKLTGNISMTNMVLFDHKGKLKRYSTPHEILDEFYEVRLALYEKRKVKIIEKMESELLVIENKARFIKMIVEKRIKVTNRPKKEIFENLKSLDFDLVLKQKAENEESKQEKGYDYLLSMAIWTLTMERFEKLKEEAKDLKEKLRQYRLLPIKDIWLKDLSDLEEALDKEDEEYSKLSSRRKKAKKEKKKKAPKSNLASNTRKGFFQKESSKTGIYSKMIKNEDWEEEDIKSLLTNKKANKRKIDLIKSEKILSKIDNLKTVIKNENLIKNDQNLVENGEKKNLVENGEKKNLNKKTKLSQKNIEAFTREDWQCGQCTFANNWDASNCDICGSEKSRENNKSKKMKQKELVFQ